MHLSYCNIDEDGGEALSDVLENARSALEVMNLNGNKLGGVGLGKLCRGLFVNTKLEKLMLADNNIEYVRDASTVLACLCLILIVDVALSERG